MDRLRKVKNIFHIVNLVLGLIFWAMLTNITCVYCKKHTAFTQFVDATAHGFLITMFILCIGICVLEDIERQTEMTIAYMGGIFHTLSTVFLVLGYEELNKNDHLQMIFLIAFGFMLAISYFTEAIFATVKNETLDAEV